MDFENADLLPDRGATGKGGGLSFREIDWNNILPRLAVLFTPISIHPSSPSISGNLCLGNHGIIMIVQRNDGGRERISFTTSGLDNRKSVFRCGSSGND